MAIGASIARGLGGGLLVVAALVAVGSIIAFATAMTWIEDAQNTGNDDKGEAGSDMFLGSIIGFASAVAAGFIGGVLFFTGGALIKRYQARMAESAAMPPLPNSED